MMPEIDEFRRRELFVAESCGGIQPAHEVFYIHTILYAADHAHAAFCAFDVAVAEGAADARVFSLMQEALTHAAALSRFFWPMKTKEGSSLSQARGRKLREAFQLTEASPLRERHLRNAFEHFDEDLDRYLLFQDAGNFFPAPQVGDHILADESIHKIFKLVDPKAGICVLLGKKFAYEPIRREVNRVLGLAGATGHAGRLPRKDLSSGINPSESFDRFHAGWATGLCLRSQQIVESLDRAQDSEWNHVPPAAVPHTPGEVRLLIRLGSANLLGSFAPTLIDDLVEDWRSYLEDQQGDHRALTRQIITRSIVLNRHRGGEAEMLLRSALWLIATKSDAEELVSLMRRGDVEVRYDINLEAEQKTRFHLSFEDLSVDDT